MNEQDMDMMVAIPGFGVFMPFSIIPGVLDTPLLISKMCVDDCLALFYTQKLGEYTLIGSRYHKSSVVAT